jgi:hypothetical protein
MKKANPVFIEWVDSSSSRRGWEDVESIQQTHRVGTLICHSIGYVIDEDKKAITLSGHLAYGNPDDNAQVTAGHCPMTIPKVSILRKKTLKI